LIEAAGPHRSLIVNASINMITALCTCLLDAYLLHYLENM
jgi:hypothetical protein